MRGVISTLLATIVIAIPARAEIIDAEIRGAEAARQSIAQTFGDRHRTGFMPVNQATGPNRGAGARGCTFESLSPADRSRYQSRYRRRVRTDGKAVADQWLHEQACMTAEQRKAARRRPLTDKQGRPCTKTRLEMRVTPGFDGAMTMSPIPVCAN